MNNKLVSAGLALLTGAAMFTPSETSARGGLFVGARATPMRAAAVRAPVMRRSIGAPVAARPVPPARPFVHASQIAAGSERRLAPSIPRHQHIVGFGLPLTVVGGSAFYGTAYDPGDDVPDYLPYAPPYANPAIITNPAPPPLAVPPVVERQHQCRTQVQTFPTERGAPYTINIVRC